MKMKLYSLIKFHSNDIFDIFAKVQLDHSMRLANKENILFQQTSPREIFRRRSLTSIACYRQNDLLNKYYQNVVHTSECFSITRLKCLKFAHHNLIKAASPFTDTFVELLMTLVRKNCYFLAFAQKEGKLQVLYSRNTINFSDLFQSFSLF